MLCETSSRGRCRGRARHSGNPPVPENGTLALTLAGLALLAGVARRRR